MKISIHPRPGFGWGKAERLRKHSQFCRVQSKGKRLGGKFILMILSPSSFLAPRCGITVSKKVGNAVIRNKLKRRFRDILRHHKAELPVADYVWIARPGADTATYAQLSHEFLSLIERARKQFSKKDTQSHKEPV